MRVENAPGVDRFIGVGPEAFQYSIRLNAPCTQVALLSLVDREITQAKKLGRKTLEWKAYDIPPLPFLPEALQQAGFVLRRESRLMYVETTAQLEISSDVELCPVTSDSDFDVLLDVNEAAFGARSDWLNQGLRFEVRDQTDRVKAWVVKVGGKPASAGWIKIYSGIGILFGGGTHPELRGRGAYRALVSERLRWARAAGARFIMSECSPHSERILRALGFTDAGRACQWVYGD